FPASDPGLQNGAFIIKVLTALPTLNTNTTIIDGSTQTTATGNTNTAGPEIVIDGSAAPSGTNGISISSNSNQIRNLVINNFFGGAGILIRDASRGNIVANCYIGTDPTGTGLAGNQTGVRLLGGSTQNTIGGS